MQSSRDLVYVINYNKVYVLFSRHVYRHGFLKELQGMDFLNIEIHGLDNYYIAKKL